MNLRKSIRKWLGIPEAATIDRIGKQIAELKNTLQECFDTFNAMDGRDEEVNDFDIDDAALKLLSVISMDENGIFVINGSLACTGSVSAKEARNITIEKQ